MVGVAQLVEHLVVAQVVVGSSPITHPILKYKKALAKQFARAFLYCGPPVFLVGVIKLNNCKTTHAADCSHFS
jgi:hypothetical protein